MAVTGGEARDNVLASRTRQRVLALVAESEEPLDTAQIASDIEIHLTTVRFHLKQLEDAGLVRRQIQKEPRRGRPRVVFRAGPVVRNDTSRRHLIDVLAGALAREDDASSRSIQAGRMWADDLAEAKPDVSGNGADALLRVLERVGFDPVVDNDGVIRLLACPFRDAATAFPQIVCSIHRGLIERTLDLAGGDPCAVRLNPFIEPELCTVTLGIGAGVPVVEERGSDSGRR